MSTYRESGRVEEPIPITHVNAGGTRLSISECETALKLSNVNEDWNALLPANDMIEEVFLSRVLDGRGQRMSAIWHMNTLLQTTIEPGSCVTNALTQDLVAYGIVHEFVCCDAHDAVVHVHVKAWNTPIGFRRLARPIIAYLIVPLSHLSTAYRSRRPYHVALCLPPHITVREHIHKAVEDVQSFLKLEDQDFLPHGFAVSSTEQRLSPDDFRDILSNQILRDHLHYHQLKFFGSARSTGLVFVKGDLDLPLGYSLPKLPIDFDICEEIRPWLSLT